MRPQFYADIFTTFLLVLWLVAMLYTEYVEDHLLRGVSFVWSKAIAPAGRAVCSAFLFFIALFC